jgi:hypothetical protein
MPARIDVIGRRFDRAVVIKNEPSVRKHRYVRCKCDCGKEFVSRLDALTRGITHSCGCYHKDVITKHGMWESSEYSIWVGILQRCENPHHRAWKRYGGRGIRVSNTWHSFEQFYRDMGDKPQGKTLDRINNDGDYSPDNCRWATCKEQSRNRDDNRTLTFNGETLCIAEWAERLGIRDGTLRERINRGWTTLDAITIPIGRLE